MCVGVCPLSDCAEELSTAVFRFNFRLQPNERWSAAVDGRALAMSHHYHRRGEK